MLDDGVIIPPVSLRCLDAAIVDVGDVLHVGHAVAAVGQIAPQHVEKKKGSRVPEVRLRGRREATNVDANLAVAQRLELLDRARSSVIEFQRHRSLDHPAPGFVAGRFALLQLVEASLELLELALQPDDCVGRRIGHLDLRADRNEREPACRLARRCVPERRRRSRWPGTSFTTTEPPPTFALSPSTIAPSTLALHADRDVAAERRMALAVREARAAERDALIDRAAVADLRGFADDDARAVIDEDALADASRRMDLDLRQKARDVGEKAREQRNPGAIERVIDAMRDERVKTRIREDDVEPAARGRVALDAAPAGRLVTLSNGSSMSGV